MSEGFVTFTDENYSELAKVLVESIKQFSDKYIQLFTINYDSELDYPNLIKTRLNTSDVTRFGLMKLKIQAAIENNFSNFVMLDADMIVNKSVNDLIDMSYHSFSYPLYSSHPSDPDNQKCIMDFIGITEKSMPYVHAATWVANEGCRDFLRECLRVYNSIPNTIYPLNRDETIMNCMLWKAGARYRLNTYNPNIDVFESYQKNNLHPRFSYHTFHGGKDYRFNRECFEWLKNESIEDFRKKDIKLKILGPN
jgi:hypothetical protein